MGEAEITLDEGTIRNYVASMEPSPSGSGRTDEFYVAMRRFIIYKKVQAGKLQRQSWRCNDGNYLVYREYIQRKKHMPGQQAAAETIEAPPSPTSSSSEDSPEFWSSPGLYSPPPQGRPSKGGQPSWYSGEWSPPSASPVRSRGSVSSRKASGHQRSSSVGGLAHAHSRQSSFGSGNSPQFASISRDPFGAAVGGGAERSGGGTAAERGGGLVRPSGSASVSLPLPPGVGGGLGGLGKQTGSSLPSTPPAPAPPPVLFAGIQCIFTDCKVPVIVVKFGPVSSDLLAFGAADGSLWVATTADPAEIKHQLKGHTRDVTDLDWSLSCQYLMSCSLDKSVRVWSVDKGECIRIIYESSLQLCARFHLVNNNFLLVGNANRELAVFNFSTGRAVNRLSIENSVTAMDVATSGNCAFIGDAVGGVHSVTVDPHTGAAQHQHVTHAGVARRAPVSSVAFRSFSLLANGAVLLAAGRDGSLRYFTVSLEVHGHLSLRASLLLAPCAPDVRAAFCPALSLSLDKGELIVTGGENSSICFYDFTKLSRPLVHKLQAHAAPVVDFSWCHGETLLASCDSSGVIIVWKRAEPGEI